MTNEEEKILEEEDITLEDAAEEAEELQEETQDEGRAIEIPIERREEIQERQVFRGGLRGAADPNMIQKHIDNFLAMLCGETPVDSNVRTSAEYWLKRLATGEGGGSTKKIYCHPIVITFTNNSQISCLVFNNDPTPFTVSSFIDWVDALYEQVGDVIRIICSGSIIVNTSALAVSFMARRGTTPYYRVAARADDGTQSFLDYATKSAFVTATATFSDGVNAIN